MTRTRTWSLATGLLVALVIDRWWIHLSSGHLLFHVDGAEYFYLRAMAPFAERSTGSLLTDFHDRRFFLRSFAQVADLAFHGSTLLPGVVLHVLHDKLGVAWSASTLKGAALGYATLTVVLWMALLGWIWRTPGAVWRFGALALLGPAVFVKLNLLHWGTHEQVMMWHAAFLLAVGVWLRGDGDTPGATGLVRALVRAAALGASCALLALLNYSLLLPGLFTLAWIAVRDAHAYGKERGLPTIVGAGGASLAVGGVTLAAGLWILAQIDLLEAVGFTAALWRDGKMDEAMSVSSFHGPWDAVRGLPLGTWSLLPGAAVAATVWVTRLWRRDRPIPATPLLFLSAYLLAAGLAIAVLPVAYDELGVWRPRFLAHLWPVAFGVIALWCAQREDWLRRGVLIAVLVTGLPVQWSHLDVGNLGAGSRYDGTRLFELTFDEEGIIPTERLRLAGVSRDFLIGFGVLRSYQSMEYWRWTPPRRAARMDHTAVLRNYPGAPGLPRATAVPPGVAPLDAAIAAQGLDSAEFYRGVGYAYSVLLPASRSRVFDDLVSDHPGHADALRAGYASPAVP
jgi:hypothetical protein